VHHFQGFRVFHSIPFLVLQVISIFQEELDVAFALSFGAYLSLVWINEIYPRPTLEHLKVSGSFKTGLVEFRHKGLLISVFYPTFEEEKPHNWLYYGYKSLQGFAKATADFKRENDLPPTFFRHLLSTKFFAARKAPILPTEEQTHALRLLTRQHLHKALALRHLQGVGQSGLCRLHLRPSRYF